MDESTYLKAKQINDELNKNENVLLLNELDKKMNDSFEVYSLSKKKDEMLEKYLSNKELYGEDNEITKESLRQLVAAKEELNNHPLVKQYLEVYSKVRDLYLEINEIILGDFRGNETCR